MSSPYHRLSGLGCCPPVRIYDESVAIRYDAQKLLRPVCHPLVLDVVVASVTLAGIVLEGGGRGQDTFDVSLTFTSRCIGKITLWTRDEHTALAWKSQNFSDHFAKSPIFDPCQVQGKQVTPEFVDGT